MYNRNGGGPIIPLQKWSDVAFPEYRHICQGSGNNPNELKYIFRHNILNDPTRRIILKACTDAGTTNGPPKAPGVTWNIDTEAGKAFLGSPNGNGVGYFLLMHRADLGWKIVKVGLCFWLSFEFGVSMTLLTPLAPV